MRDVMVLLLGWSAAVLNSLISNDMVENCLGVKEQLRGLTAPVLPAVGAGEMCRNSCMRVMFLNAIVILLI